MKKGKKASSRLSLTKEKRVAQIKKYDTAQKSLAMPLLRKKSVWFSSTKCVQRKNRRKNRQSLFRIRWGMDRSLWLGQLFFQHYPVYRSIRRRQTVQFALYACVNADNGSNHTATIPALSIYSVLFSRLFYGRKMLDF